jgi:molecular chaperone IbpA|tara:strand:- start:322 stop:771 length:450 start_codon:yes stop_codon:yes gene_type:complete
MTNKALSIFNRLRPVSVGFDSIFDHFGSMWDDDFINDIQPSYPPYNIVKSGKNTYDIEVALAGFNKKDINVEVENGMLTIETKKEDKESSKKEDGEVIHKGISKRYFKRSFTIANDVKVKGAELKDGLLRVSMEKIIPEEMKLKTIDVK